MNILLIHNSTEINNGASAHVVFLLKNLPFFDIQPFLISIRKDLSSFNVKVSNKDGLTFKTSKQVIKFLLSFCRKNKIDLIHNHTFLQIDILRFLARQYPLVKTLHNASLTCLSGDKFYLNSHKTCTLDIGYKCIFHAYTEKCAGVRHPKKLYERFRNVLLERKEAGKIYQFIIAPSLFIQRECLSHGLSADHVIRVPYPFEIEEKEVLRERKPVKTILFAGRIEKSKGAHLIPEIFFELLSDRSDVILKIAGDGFFKIPFLEKIRESNLTNIQYLGWIDQKELYSLYKETDIVIIPSVYPDNFPIICLEAMAWSIPIVTFNVGGLPEMVLDGYNGFVVPSTNLNEMKEKISNLLDNEDLRIQMGANGQKRLKENFSPHVVMPKLIELYKKAFSIKKVPESNLL